MWYTDNKYKEIWLLDLAVDLTVMLPRAEKQFGVCDNDKNTAGAGPRGVVLQEDFVKTLWPRRPNQI